MTETEQGQPPAPKGPGPEFSSPGWPSGAPSGPAPGYPPAGWGGQGPVWPAAGPGGSGAYPGGLGSPLAPPPRSFFREHPLILILLLLLVVGAIVTIISAAVGSQLGGDGLGGMSFGKKVGVVKIEGVIMDSKAAVDQLHRYADDDSVAAVVIRVESPGGTVGAAQEIHDEVKKLAAKKKVVVSMGSVAASGGYYVACPAHAIFANPGTITGSIGVVLEITNLESLFKWMKVQNEVIKSGAMKDVGSPYREMTPEERAYLQSFVDNVHLQFEAAVAQGRKIPPADVHKIADGRIFTGVQAKDLHLVDELGDLWDAIDKAAKLGGIRGEPRVIWPPERGPSLFRELFGMAFPKWAAGNGALASPVRLMYIVNFE